MFYLRIFRIAILVMGVMSSFAALQTTVAAVNEETAVLEKAAVVRFTGQEGISTLFTYELDLATSVKNLNLTNAVGRPLLVKANPGRTVHGMIERIEQLGLENDRALYRIRLVPTVAKLKHTVKSRTFQEMNVPDIVEEVFGNAGIASYEYRLTDTYPQREMIVQHQETDFTFISRLMEQEGIHYHFEPASSGHKMVLSDHNQGFPVLPKGALIMSPTRPPSISSFSRGHGLHAGRVEVSAYNFVTPTTDLTGTTATSVFQDLTEHSHPSRSMSLETDFTFISRLMEQEGIHYHFEPASSGHKMVLSDHNQGFPVLPKGALIMSPTRPPSISSFSRGHGLHAGSVEVSAYNFVTPTTDLTGTAATSVFQDLTEHSHPSHVNTKSYSAEQAGIRLDTRIAHAQQCTGEASYAHLQAGHRIVLSGHYRKDFNREYVITAIEHTVTPQGYSTTFHCLPSNITYRPLPITPTPKIAGVVSGIVTGPAGEEKYVDEFGRVKVAFPWRSPAFRGPYDEKSSAWIRVMQLAAGRGSTTMWLPSVGDEVAVAFEHGDPSRPVVLGDLYNAVRMPPVALPDNKTLTVFRGYSEPGGGGFNEIVFENQAGAESVVMHGQKDMQVEAMNDMQVEAKNDMRVQAARDMNIQAANDMSLQTTTQMSLHAGQDQTGKPMTQVLLDLKNSPEGFSVRTGKEILLNGQGTVTVDSANGVTVTTPKQVFLGGSQIQVNSAQEQHLTDGTFQVKSLGFDVETGSEIILKGGTSITLRSGNHYLTIGPFGIIASTGIVTP